MKTVYYFSPLFRSNDDLVGGSCIYADRVVYDKVNGMLSFFIGEHHSGFVDCLHLVKLRQFTNCGVYEIPWNFQYSESPKTELILHI